jgi:hypothetical protein
MESLMLGYPYTYGDILDVTTANCRKKIFIANFVLYSFMFCTSAGVSYAQEVTSPGGKGAASVAPINQKQTEKIVAAAACMAAGNACTKTKAGISVVACGFFLGWCLAKASPI